MTNVLICLLLRSRTRSNTCVATGATHKAPRSTSLHDVATTELVLPSATAPLASWPSCRYDTSRLYEKTLTFVPRNQSRETKSRARIPSMKVHGPPCPNLPFLSSLRASRAAGTARCQTCVSDTLFVGRIVPLRLGSQLIQLRLRTNSRQRAHTHCTRSHIYTHES